MYPAGAEGSTAAPALAVVAVPPFWGNTLASTWAMRESSLFWLFDCVLNDVSEGNFISCQNYRIAAPLLSTEDAANGYNTADYTTCYAAHIMRPL
jgi:hypothetical protein